MNKQLFKSIGIESILAVIYFLINILAMIFYSGGTKENVDYKGYSIIGNYFSDLGMTKAYNGDTNILAMILFSLGLITISIAIILFSKRIYSFSKIKKTSIKHARLLILISSFILISCIGVSVTPLNLAPKLHMVFVYSFSFLFLLYLIVYSFLISKNINYKKGFKYINYIYFIMVLSYTCIVGIFSNQTSIVISTLLIVGQKAVIYLGIIGLLIQFIGFKNYEMKENE